VPGIYAGDRLPVDRIARGTPALIDSDDVYTNHIHADDLANLIKACLYRAKPQRITNACDDSSLKMGDYFDLVANAYGLKKSPRLSRLDLAQQVDPMLLSFMSESRRIKNRRLNELRFRLTYPTVEDFLRTISSRL
jgi:NAD dependent epimerase/dehydratase family enzyme